MAVTAAQIMGATGDDVATITIDRRVREASSVLAERRIGALVVVDDGHAVVGVISERDIVGRLASDGGACLDLEVGTVMTEPVVTVTGDEPTEQLMQIMTDGRFRHVPVVDGDGRLVGIVSVGDVVKSTIDRLEVEKEALQEYVAGGY